MAKFVKLISCLLLLVLYTCCQSEAREGRFFSKYIHLRNYVTVPSSGPITSQISYAPAPAPAPAPLGPGQGNVRETENSYFGLYAKGSTNDFPPEKTTIIDDEEVGDEFFNEELKSENSEEKLNTYSDSFRTSNEKRYDTNGYYDSDGGYRSTGPQGMSDTRLLDNEELVRENNIEEIYNDGSYNKKSKYEFESMEEYEKQQGYYSDVQQEFIP